MLVGLPVGVYERSPQEKKRLTKQIQDWVRIHGGPNKDKKIPRELVEKQRHGRLEYYKSHEVNNNNKGKPHSEATKRKISESMRKWWSQLGVKKRMAEAAKLRHRRHKTKKEEPTE
jgi:hypothetical protein